jgi:hypothetical protein
MTLLLLFSGSSGAAVTGVPGTVALGYAEPAAAVAYALPAASVAYATPTTTMVITL